MGNFKLLNKIKEKYGRLNLFSSLSKYVGKEVMLAFRVRGVTEGTTERHLRFFHPSDCFILSSWDVDFDRQEVILGRALRLDTNTTPVVTCTININLKINTYMDLWIIYLSDE